MPSLTIKGLTEEQVDRLLDKGSQMFGVSFTTAPSMDERERYVIIVKGCEQQLYVIQNIVDNL